MKRIAILILTVGAWMTLTTPNAHAFAVATGTTWASEAAIETLKRGGNAADAMVAATFVLNVTQPYNMGVGGGGFFIAHSKGRTYLWDHREMGPASAHEKMFLDADGKAIPAYPQRVTGPNPVGVPGTVMGLYEAHRKLGRLRWKDLVAPAARLARQGFPVTAKFEETLADEWERISAIPTTAATFGDGEGGHLKMGQTLRQPLLAKTLETIGEKGALSFYKGDLARSWISEAQKLGVKMTLEDLAKYKVREATPVEFSAFGLRAVTAAPPSAAGVMVGGTLRYLENYYKTHPVPEPASPARVVVTTEALAYFQDLRNRTIGDPPHSKLDPARFYRSAEEKAAWAEIDRRVTARLDRIQTKVGAATPATQPGKSPLAAAEAAHSHTAHLAIVDDEGMAVSYTTTIEEHFGSGLVVTGHGFLLNNELSDFAAETGHPNSPAPFKRPRSNMSPLIFFQGATPVSVLGCAGGGRIPTVLVELLENYHLHKLTAREAIAHPRFHPDGEKLQVDKSLPASTVEKLKAAGYNVEVEPVGGTAQALMRRGTREKWEAASELRSDGLGISL